MGHNRGFEEGNYLIPFYRGSFPLSNHDYTYVCMCSKNPYKANAPPKRHAAGVNPPSKFPLTTRVGHKSDRRIKVNAANLGKKAKARSSCFL